MESLIKKPSAWIPIVLSLGILAMELGFLVFVAPPKPEADEGTAAHLFQIWLALEFFLVLFFAGKWVPQRPWPAARVLIMQILAVLGGMFPVFYFHL